MELDIEFGNLNAIHRDLRRLMKEFDDLTTTVNNLIAADEAENTLLAAVVAELNTLLANPQGVTPTDVTALRDKVQAELDKVNAAIGSATPPGTTGVPPATFTIGGTVQNLAAGASLTLQDNGGDDLVVSQNGPFAFATPLAAGSAYAVTISVPPSDGSNAVVTNGSGTATANVSNIGVTVAAASAAAQAAAAKARKL